MSALGQKQTSRHLQRMSALPPIADIGANKTIFKNFCGSDLPGQNFYTTFRPLLHSRVIASWQGVQCEAGRSGGTSISRHWQSSGRPLKRQKSAVSCCAVCRQNGGHFPTDLKNRGIPTDFGGPWLHQVPISSSFTAFSQISHKAKMTVATNIRFRKAKRELSPSAIVGCAKAEKHFLRSKNAHEPDFAPWLRCCAGPTSCRLSAVPMSARCENACGKLPSCRCAVGSYSSASRPTSLRSESRRSNRARASASRCCSL